MKTNQQNIEVLLKNL